MYKEIIQLIIALISQPGKTWVSLAKREEPMEQFLSRFIYPLIGLVTVAAFLGVLFTRKEFDFELALKVSIKSLAGAFGGFYLASYTLNVLAQKVLGWSDDLKLWQRFVGYSSSLMYALQIVLALLPEFFFFRIFVVYTFYIIWEGSGPYMQVDDSFRMKFVGGTTFIVLVSPMAIGILLSMLMPGLSNV